MATAKRNAIKLLDVVTGEQIAALGDVDLDGDKARVAGYEFRINCYSEEWECVVVPPTAAEKAAQRDAARVRDAARAMSWHEFVCWHVARRTARKAHEGYTVRKSANGWAIMFGGCAQVDRDANTVYGWLERLPLVTLSREADAARYEALT